MKYLLTVLISSLTFLLFAQEASIKESIFKGHASGYFRSFYMSSHNKGELKDWYALAAGGLLKYETQTYKGFSVGAGFYHSSNLNITDVTEVDPTTGKVSRYELGLFDVNDPSRREISLLGEVYLSYTRSNHQLVLGRFKYKSPFLNPEDGRMIPTLMQGIHYTFKSTNKKLKAEGLWVSHIGARSTSRFMTTAASLGSYPVGLNPDGSKSLYNNNTTSLGLGVASLNYKGDAFGVKFYNYFFKNVYNSAFIEPSYTMKGKLTSVFKAQYLVQTKVNDGGNKDAQKAYFQDDIAQVWGVSYGVKTEQKWKFTANYNFVTKDGRYLFPREWGREFLFTFQKRERLEGAANTQAWMLEVNKVWNFNKKGAIDLSLGYGQYCRPDAKDFENNKYAFPANDQLRLDLFWFANTSKKGLSLELLFAYKRAIGETYDNPNFILHKVDMLNSNLIMNYKF